MDKKKDTPQTEGNVIHTTNDTPKATGKKTVTVTKATKKKGK